MKYTILFLAFWIIAARSAEAYDYERVAFTNPADHNTTEVGDTHDPDWYSAKAHERLFWEYNEIRNTVLALTEKDVISGNICKSADGIPFYREFGAKKNFKATPPPPMTSKVTHLHGMIRLVEISLLNSIQDDLARRKELVSMRTQMQIIDQNCINKEFPHSQFDSKAVLSALEKIRQEVEKGLSPLTVAENILKAQYRMWTTFHAAFYGTHVVTEKTQIKGKPKSDDAAKPVDDPYSRSGLVTK